MRGILALLLIASLASLFVLPAAAFNPAEHALCTWQPANWPKCLASKAMAEWAQAATQRFYQYECSYPPARPRAGETCDMQASRLCDAPSRGGLKPTCQFQGNGNAFQHAYWNALMRFFQGYEWAEAVAGAHEGNQDFAAAPPDRKMDYLNNQAGRDSMSGFFVTIPGAKPYSFEEEKNRMLIARRVMDWVAAGRMVRLARYGGAAPRLAAGCAGSTVVLVPTSGNCRK